MKKVLFLLGLCLVCLSHEAESVGKIWSKLCNSGANDYVDTDFAGLNKWLKSGLPNDEDPSRNLEYAKGNLKKISKRRLRRAAEIFVNFLDAKQCDHQLLGSFMTIRVNEVDLEHPQRAEKLMYDRLDDLNELCIEFIGESIDNLTANYQWLESSIARDFLDVVVLRPNQWEAPVGRPIAMRPGPKLLHYISHKEDHSLDPKQAWWVEKLTELMRGRFNKFRDALLTEVVVREYMMKPCGQISAPLGHLPDYLYALSHYVPGNGQTLLHLNANRSSVFQLLYAAKVCDALLKMKGHRKWQLVEKAVASRRLY